LSFSIYTRMSVAYRSQSAVSELQQSLQAAQMEMIRHLRLAGHMMPNGFRVLGDLEPRSPVQVMNRAAGVTFPADVVKVYYADVSAKAMIVNDPDNTSVLVDDVDSFEVGDLALIVNPKWLTEPPTSAMSGPAPIMGAD